ncbi:MAG: pantetheine-phosphate adenylyltransferase [Deinococcales bacterium]
MTHALYPGSFDPLHNGHLDVIERSSPLFHQLTVAVLHNPLKPSALFSLDVRLTILKESCNHLKNVDIKAFSGLLIDSLETFNANIIIKGLRNSSDYNYEWQMAHINRHLNPRAETLFILSDPAWSYLSSTRVRELASYQADISSLVPSASLKALNQKFGAA